MAPLLRGSFRCAICDRPVSLQVCKVDEDGRPVHESCYIQQTLQYSRREHLEDVLAENGRRKR